MMKIEQRCAELRVPIWAKLKPALAALGLGLSLILTSGSAQALSFTFAFSTPTNVDGSGNTISGTGTVTGIIQGLTDNLANQAATAVSITSYTPVDPSLPPVTIALTKLFVNQFTVAGGQITAANFLGSDANVFTVLDLNENGIRNILYDSQNLFSLQNLDGFTGATYTPIPSVPELPAPLMISFGMLVPLLVQRARKVKPRRTR